MSIQYRGDDGRIHSLGDNDSLQHWKYIKKIQTGSGPRYFYTMEELRAFYNEEKTKANNKYERNVEKIDREHANNVKDIRKWHDARERGIDKTIYMTNGKIEKNGSEERKDRKNNEKWTSKALQRESRDFNAKKDMARIKADIDPVRKVAKKSVDKPINEMKKSSSAKIEKGRSKVEKKLNKAKKTAKSEVKGVKRASNAIRGKGNNFYDAHDTAPKSYSSYDKKKKKFGKNKKTGRAERAMIYAYRRTHPNE